MQNKIYRKLLNLELFWNTLLYICIKKLRKASNLSKIKLFKFEESWEELQGKTYLHRQSREKLMKNKERKKETIQNHKSLLTFIEKQVLLL